MGVATSYAISELAAQKEEQQQTSETTSRPCCRAWLRLLGYLYASLLQTRKPLLLDPDVRGRTDGSLAEGWWPDPGGGRAAAELRRYCAVILETATLGRRDKDGDEITFTLKLGQEGKCLQHDWMPWQREKMQLLWM